MGTDRDPIRRPRWAAAGIVGGFHVPAMCGAPPQMEQEMERDISRDGSYYSISSGMLPSLGARSNRRVKLHPLIVSPYDKRYRYVAQDSFQRFFFLNSFLKEFSERINLYEMIWLDIIDGGIDCNIAV